MRSKFFDIDRFKVKYSGIFYIDFHINTDIIYIYGYPVLQSSVCNLNGLSPKELVRRGEEAEVRELMQV